MSRMLDRVAVNILPVMLLAAILVSCAPVDAQTVSADFVWPTFTPHAEPVDAVLESDSHSVPLFSPPVTPMPSFTPTPTLLPESAPATPTPELPPVDTVPERIVIPALGIDRSVTAIGWHPKNGQGIWDDPGLAGGWVDDSALPGHGSNIVIVGHQNGDGIFRNLVDLSDGDEVHLYVHGVAYTYRVHERFILPEHGASEAQRRQNALWIAPTVDERLTMVTCWPHLDNSHRLIVIARPVN
ncbi:MAG TPA: sortase [Chloroflexi bacterium]|nr:sortase [Chloroflexota bacterium]